MGNLFLPPFNNQLYLKRKRIKKDILSQDVEWLCKRIAILGGSTTHDIKELLELFLLNQGIKPVFYESEYNQYWHEVMFDSVGLDQFEPEIIYIHTNYRNIARFPEISDSRESVDGLLDSTYMHFSDMWDRIDEKYNCVIIQNNFDYPYWRLQGNREASDYHGSVNYLTRLNVLFAEYAQTHDKFFIHDINYLSAICGLDNWFSPFEWYMYKNSVSIKAMPLFVHSLSNIIKSLCGRNKKAFALDLDNTLWGGVVGDDGVENLKIGKETPTGEAFTEFQEYIKAHRQLGVILNVISKNELENAKEGLEHPDMTLKSDDFITIKANWEPKSQNLIDVAKELSLTPDSFVFIDDNPAEREIVRKQIKGIAVPDIGNRPEEFIRAVDRMGYFEVTLTSKDDLNRDRMYKENAQRAKELTCFSDYTDYLRSLEMKAEIVPFSPTYFDRIVQLSNKSNQFNLTTRRYTQSEIEGIAKDDSYITLSGKLSDKFGDNGVVSVVIGHQNGDEVDVELWIMSCRVLKRDVEFAMMDVFVDKCRERDVNLIIGHYYPTSKNGLVKNFYELMGFEKTNEDEIGNSNWIMDVSNYVRRNYVIELI